MLKLTAKQLKLLHKKLNGDKAKHPIEQVSKEQRDKDTVRKWTARDNPYSILVGPHVEMMTMMKGIYQIIGAYEVSYGRLCLWDGEEWHISLGNSIVTPSWVFIGDYYGYPEGRLYLHHSSYNDLTS